MEQSRNKNPYYQREKKAAASGESSIKVHQQPPEEEQEVRRYAGLEAHSGQTVKMPSRGTLRSQATTHRLNMQQDKRQIKLQKKQVVDRKERMKQQQVCECDVFRLYLRIRTVEPSLYI